MPKGNKIHIYISALQRFTLNLLAINSNIPILETATNDNKNEVDG